jgi:hypothetical protein
MRLRPLAAVVLSIAVHLPPAFSQSASAPQASRPLPSLPAVACARGPITFEGGDGSSKEKAVVVKGAPTGLLGIRAEYDWLKQNYPGYKRKSQALLPSGAKSYDVLAIEMPDGKELSIYFDVSDIWKDPAPPEWTLTSVATSPAKRKFVDLKTIRPSGNYLHACTMYDADQEESTPGGIAFRSAKQLEEFDCARGQGRLVGVAYSSGNMGGGAVVESGWNMPTSLGLLRPTSMNEATAQVVCNLDGYLAQPKTWEEFGEAEGMSLFIDRSAFRRIGSVARVRVMFDFTRPRSHANDPPIRSQVLVSEYDCEKKLRRPISMVNYSGQRGTGQVTEILSASDAPFTASSDQDEFVEGVCDVGDSPLKTGAAAWTIVGGFALVSAVLTLFFFRRSQG